LGNRLENRLVLSHSAIHQAAHVVHHQGDHLGHHQSALAHPSVVISLSGSVESQEPLNGSGIVSPLGAVTSTGTLTAHGAEPVTYTGTVTLVGRTGSVTASLFGRLFGPQYPGEPVNLTYTITGGTGAFAGASGSGRAVFRPLISATGGFELSFVRPTV
jgi:hypothetical protein